MEQTNIFTHTVSVDTRTRMYGPIRVYSHTLSVLNTRLCQLMPGLECMEQTNIFTHSAGFEYNTGTFGRFQLFSANQYPEK